MSKKTNCSKTYLKLLKIIIEKELKTKNLEELDLNLYRSYAKSIAEFIEAEKQTGKSTPKLLLEGVHRV